MDILDHEHQMNEINEAYIKALAACKRAAKAGKQYIALQACKKGGYRLAAVDYNYNGETSYRFDMLPADWAQNVIYRLRECCLLQIDVDTIAEFFDMLAGRTLCP